ncbi:MAG: putative DNA binding domain-containing protein [Oscillospiraceae bacterium]|nr:putative DNA binding domain-containing protein [Oscillospiraceae bacterium]
MRSEDLKSLIGKIQTTKAEFQNIEVKKCKDGITEKLYDTLSSFSNQDEGGIIVFGLDEKAEFEITGIDDVQLLQRRVSEQCEQMQPAVRPVFTVTQVKGLNIVSAEIPPVDISERPCFYKGKGRLKGAYVRVGEADVPMTEYEVYSYEAYRRKYRDELRVVERSDMDSLDKSKLERYLTRLKSDKPNLSRLDDKKIIDLMSICIDNVPTLAAQMLFGLYPQAYFPQLSVIAVCIPGTEMGETDSDNSRFTDNKRIDGTIPDMLREALSFVLRNSRSKTIIDPATGKRQDRTDYPMNSVREALLNALVHRDYSIHTEGMPIQLKLFSDRLEITNPGGLYGRLTVDTLGKIQPDTRNPVIATALEVMNITENRYSGIPTMIREMKEHRLPSPEFINIGGDFTVILRQNNGITETVTNETVSLLEFCRTPRTRKEIAGFLRLSSVTYAIKTHLQPLIDEGKIALAIPDRPSSPNQRYYTVSSAGA